MKSQKKGSARERFRVYWGRSSDYEGKKRSFEERKEMRKAPARIGKRGWGVGKRTRSRK